ncbi:MAG: ComEC/Rec2 family competence protein, partial [Gemmatimonadetes bacterium]|nr:ComEC/Rec2 family competence protein [Gemmatimonadota bacterium]
GGRGGRGGRGGGHHPLLGARGAAQERLQRLYGKRAALAEALLLAQRDGLDAAVWERFADSGLIHLLAISGLHVGLVATSLLLVCSLLRLAPGLSAGAAALVTVAYVLFLGAPYAAARAALQVLLLLGARLLQRPAHPVGLLATAALVLLAIEPLAALDAGFQLSFAGTAGIIVLRRRLLVLPWLPGPAALRDALATSLAATLATAPLSVLHFGRLAPVGVLASLAAIPLVALAVPALALALAASWLLWPAAEFLANGGGLLLAALDAAARWGAWLPAGHLAVPRDLVAAWFCAALLACIFAAQLAAPSAPAAGTPEPRVGAAGVTSRTRVRPWVRRLAAGGAAVAFLLAWPLAVRRLGAGELQIHVIDVGQGDALALRSPAGRWLLVDAGPRSDTYDAGRARVVPFLLRHGVRRLEALILTHPDADHIGGSEAVLNTLPVGLVVDPGAAAGKPLYLLVLQEARREGIRWVPARAGRELRFDGLVIEFLHPQPASLDGKEATNESSVVFRLAYGRFTALFLGDAPAAVERELAVRHGGRLRVDVLKVGHHGSGTSSSEELLAAATPRLALISVGRHNRYGHPHPEVLRRLAGRRVRVLRTDWHGEVTVRARASGELEFETARS